MQKLDHQDKIANTTRCNPFFFASSLDGDGANKLSIELNSWEIYETQGRMRVLVSDEPRYLGDSIQAHVDHSCPVPASLKGTQELKEWQWIFKLSP